MRPSFIYFVQFWCVASSCINHIARFYKAVWLTARSWHIAIQAVQVLNQDVFNEYIYSWKYFLLIFINEIAHFWLKNKAQIFSPYFFTCHLNCPVTLSLIITIHNPVDISWCMEASLNLTLLGACSRTFSENLCVSHICYWQLNLSATCMRSLSCL